MAHPVQTPDDTTISVIVPAYNVGEYIEHCLHSILGQTLRPLEVIVVDDGSTDDTFDRISDLAESDDVLTVIRQDNRGLSAARNAGLDLARGTYIAFADGDDFLRPDYLEKLFAAICAADAPWAACAISYLMASGQTRDHSAMHDQPDLKAGAVTSRLPLNDWLEVVRHFPSAWNKIYRRDFIADTRFEEGTYYEDHAFFIELAGRAENILHVPEPLYVQRKQRKGQITSEESDRVFEQLHVLEQVRTLMTDCKPHAASAFQRLASRLISERAEVLRAPDLRARFLQKARNDLGRWQTTFEPLGAEGISPILALEMSGRVPLSVIVPVVSGSDRFSATLETLFHGIPCGFETLLVGPEQCLSALKKKYAADFPTLNCGFVQVEEDTIPAAFNAGLERASGAYVLFAEPGAEFHDKALLNWSNQVYCTGADLGVSRAANSFASDSCFHDALSEESPARTHLIEQVKRHPLALRADLSARLFDRSFLLNQKLLFAKGLLTKQIFVSAAFQRAEKVVHLADNEIFLPDRCQGMLLMRDSFSWHELMTEIETVLPQFLPPSADANPDWTVRLAARAFWEVFTYPAGARYRRIPFYLSALRWFWSRNISASSRSFDRSIGPAFRNATRGWLPFTRVCIKKLKTKTGIGKA